MVFRLCTAAIVSVLLCTTILQGMASAADSDGLSISPVRSEQAISPGKTAKGEVTIGNPSSRPINVQLEAKMFTVADYSYDYLFKSERSKDWVTFDITSFELKPGESRKIGYGVNVPADVTPGGYYFSLFASTAVSGVGTTGTVQAVSLVYMTVEGVLTRTSVLQNNSMPFIVTGSQIPYSFDVKNTGNVHFSAYFFGQVESLFFGKQPEFGTSHLLMPGAIRSIKESVPAPYMPGIYRVEYGYKVDFADIVTTQTGYIVYLPPWSIILILFIALLARWLWQKRHLQTQDKTT